MIVTRYYRSVDPALEQRRRQGLAVVRQQARIVSRWSRGLVDLVRTRDSHATVQAAQIASALDKMSRELAALERMA